LGETSLLASRTSSFQRGTETRLTTSPLISQSPQFGSRTVVATALESKFYIFYHLESSFVLSSYFWFHLRFNWLVNFEKTTFKRCVTKCFSLWSLT
jgi:hypothetical protein